MKIVFLALLLCFSTVCSAQFTVSGRVISEAEPIIGATVKIKNTTLFTQTDLNGYFEFKNIYSEKIEIVVSSVGYKNAKKEIKLPYADKFELKLESDQMLLDEVVVSGTLNEISRSESAMAIDIIKPDLFRKNASPGLFEGIQMVSGVRPQINCSICNTGDIHINGMEGPYTAVLIDGMPIVSSLGTIYGLLGIPTGMIERLEIVKGPASTLYGTEAVAGLINVITRIPGKGPKLWAETNINSWGEAAFDIGFTKQNSKASWLSGLSIFGFDRTIDKNKDGFTDLSLQKRLSWFNKVSYGKNKDGNVAMRLLIEDRWGGQTNYNKTFRGTNQVYGESIDTRRLELLGKNKLGTNLDLNYSFVSHHQDSYYGVTPFKAKQDIIFAQSLYRMANASGSYLIGLPLKYTFYDDNTIVTATKDLNKPQRLFNPALFSQYEKDLTSRLKILLAYRIDYFSNKKWVQSPRLAIKYQSIDRLGNLRINYGNGFRWVNVFSEDHAALTGARTVFIAENLKPERSHNVSANFERKIPFASAFVGLDATVFYSYFSNKIMPDYDSHPEKIFYNNLLGFVDSKGFNFSVDYYHSLGFRANATLSLLDMRNHENNQWTRPVLTEKASGTVLLSYKIKHLNTALDYTVNWVSKMRLPLQGASDPRPEYSPFTSFHNIQLTKTINKNFEFFVGVKNLFNFLPYRGLPFLIANASDPFDKNITFDNNGVALPSTQNPYGLTFDPSYVYAPLQGIRVFGGLRINF